MVHAATSYLVSRSNSTLTWDAARTITFHFNEEPGRLREALRDRILDFSRYNEDAKILGFRLQDACPPPEEMQLGPLQPSTKHRDEDD